jgi:Rho GDP-dissociation inhibitor
MAAPPPNLDAPRRQEEEDDDEEEVTELKEVEDDDDDTYTPGEMIALKKQIEMDPDDESLNKWKEDLLGKVKISSDGSKTTPEVRFHSMRLLVEGRPPLDLPLMKPATAEANKPAAHFVLKEKCKYKLEFKFEILNELVSGLTYANRVWRGKLQVAKAKEMLGSFAPQEEPYSYVTEEEVTPKGMLVRGQYTAKTLFTDDDGNLHFELNYTFEIRKEWETV